MMFRDRTAAPERPRKPVPGETILHDGEKWVVTLVGTKYVRAYREGKNPTATMMIHFRDLQRIVR